MADIRGLADAVIDAGRSSTDILDTVILMSKRTSDRIAIEDCATYLTEKARQERLDMVAKGNILRFMDRPVIIDERIPYGLVQVLTSFGRVKMWEEEE